MSEMRSGWAQTTGQVVVSEIRDVAVGGSAAIGPGPTALFRARVRYRYRVGAQEYESERIAASPEGSNLRGPQQRIVDRYPVGRPVTVHYDPAAPQESLLEMGTGTSRAWFLSSALKMLVAFAAGIVLMMVIFVAILTRVLD